MIVKIVVTATCLLLSASISHSVQINWGAGNYPILDEMGNPLEDGDLAQLIWDQDRDGIDPPGTDGLPSDGDVLIDISSIGNGSFAPGSFSENTYTGMVSPGDVLYVRAWNGSSPSVANYFGDTRDHIPTLWTIDSNLDFTLDATQNSSWNTTSGWTGVSESTLFNQTYAFSLHQNYPNPFVQTTKIIFTVPGTVTYTLGEGNERKIVSADQNTVNLKVYDVTGRLVKTLLKGSQKAGYYRMEWGGRDNGGRQVASGVYFYSLVVGEKRAVQKLVLMR